MLGSAIDIHIVDHLAGLNWNSTAGNLSDASYLGYIVIQIVGWLFAFFICSPKQVLRADGTHPPIVKIPKSHKGALDAEIKSYLLLFTDYRVFCLVPMFFSAVRSQQL